MNNQNDSNHFLLSHDNGTIRQSFSSIGACETNQNDSNDFLLVHD